jgi:LmbE family N-acetylglucosaminyl deacetylase
MKSFLLISPHVDDEAIGCGGILDSRFHVHYCGVEEHRIIDRQTRLAEAQACADLLGYSFSVNLDNRVNHYQRSELVGQIGELISRHLPITVFLPYSSYNQDHRAVLDAGLQALAPLGCEHMVKNVLLYEQVHVGCWPYREDLVQGRVFQPSCFFPIDIETKIAAYHQHRSQVRAMRSPEAIRTLARWRGLQAGTDYAEGYMVLRLCDPGHLTLGRLRPTEPSRQVME